MNRIPPTLFKSAPRAAEEMKRRMRLIQDKPISLATHYSADTPEPEDDIRFDYMLQKPGISQRVWKPLSFIVLAAALMMGWLLA